MSEKCGNCLHFLVRNRDEADLARVALSEAECRPGEWVFAGERKVGCHGGAVRGMCALWRERGAPNAQVESTFHCDLWEAGGPSLRVAGSGNRPAETGAEAGAAGGMAGLLVTFASLGALWVAGQVRRPR